jgi:hypothetical protein
MQCNVGQPDLAHPSLEVPDLEHAYHCRIVPLSVTVVQKFSQPPARPCISSCNSGRARRCAARPRPPGMVGRFRRNRPDGSPSRPYLVGSYGIWQFGIPREYRIERLHAPRIHSRLIGSIFLASQTRVGYCVHV